jgi:exodeoxyribonuclease-3
VNLGFTDALLALNPSPGFTFWDYQAGAWERNNGIRIDHVLLCPQAADLLQDAGIEKGMRGGDKPSDHVPVWVELAA